MICENQQYFMQLPSNYKLDIVEFIEARKIEFERELDCLNLREAADIRMSIKNKVKSLIVEHFAEQQRHYGLIMSYIVN